MAAKRTTLRYDGGALSGYVQSIGWALLLADVQDWGVTRWQD